MLILFWILGLVMACTMTACIYKKIDLFKMLILGATFHTAFYVLVSGVLIWMNSFNLFLPLVITLILEILIMGAMFFINDFRLPYIVIDFKKYIGLIIVLTLSGVLSSLGTAGYYGTGQDQGLYQIRAMYFMGGNFDNVVDFPEFYEIENAYEKSHYLEEVEKLVGFYRLQEHGVEDAKKMEGVFHGISTFPALLALWGSMFGLVNMPGVLIYSFLLILGNVWLICDNLKFKYVTKVICATTLGFCPIVVWASQNTLTEIVIALFICSFFEILTENQKKQLAIVTIIPIIAVCFMHVTISAIMPMIVILYVYNFIQTKDKKYLVAMVLSALGYGAGLSMMISSAWYYTTTNLERIFAKTKYVINADNILGVVWVTIGILGVLAYILSLNTVTGKMLHKWSKLKKTERGKKIAGAMLLFFTTVTIIIILIQAIKDNRNDMWLMKEGIVCYWITTGYIILPLALAAIYILYRKFSTKRNMVNIALGFIYSLLMYCGFICFSIHYYYYFTRYLVPYTFLVIIMGGFLLEKIKMQIVIPVCTVCSIIVIMQSSLIYKERDLTYGEYQILDNITSCVGENDCILIYEQGYNIHTLFALQLKGLTGVDIYYVDTARIYSQIENYNSLYDNVFVLTYDLGGAFDENNRNWRKVYEGVMNTTLYDGYVENQVLPYPSEVIEMESPIALMILQEKEDY